jgi:hypothetical protein
VDLNQVIGNDNGKLKFGGRDFAKKTPEGQESSKNIEIIERAGVNWLVADCLTKKGVYNLRSELKLDGSLQITIPNQVWDLINRKVVNLNF